MKKILLSIISIFFISTSVLAAEFSTEAMLQYNQGIDYYKAGQYENSIQCFREAIRLEPSYIDAYYNLGSVLEYLQQYDAALAVFKQIIVRKPEDYDSVYKAAWLSYKMGEYQKAKTYLKIIPPTSPRGRDSQVLMGELNALLPPPAIKKPAPQITKQTVVTPAKKTVNQTSGLYQGIQAPTGIASDSVGNVYVAEYNNNAILKITPDDKKMIFIKDPKISGPIGIAFDKTNNLYIANYNKDNVLKVSSSGTVTVLISNVKKPYGLHISDGILFVSCQGSNTVLRYKLK